MTTFQVAAAEADDREFVYIEVGEPRPPSPRAKVTKSLGRSTSLRAAKSLGRLLDLDDSFAFSPMRVTSDSAKIIKNCLKMLIFLSNLTTVSHFHRSW